MAKKGSGKRTKSGRYDKELLSDLGAAWVEAGREGSTIVFDHIDLHMLGRAGEGDYTSSRTFVAEKAYMVTFEFDEDRFEELLRLLPKDGAAQIARALGGPFVNPQIINIPPEAIVVGMRAHLGKARSNGEEAYVPLIVDSWMAPGPIMSVAFESAAPAGVLEVLQGPSGPVHAIDGQEIRDGDCIDVWLKQENNWVGGRYRRATTKEGAFEAEFALLQTERTGRRPIFLGYKARIAR